MTAVLRILFLGLFCFPAIIKAQYTIQGTVLDEQTKSALAFVTVIINEEKGGIYTDIDGKFRVLRAEPITRIRFSYVGYEAQTVSPTKDESLRVYLRPATVQIAEAVVGDTENPAHRIIREVIRRKDQNDPEKGDGFSYESYNKLIFTADIDTGLLANPERIAELDSSDQDAIAFFQKQHLFMMESVSERKFLPPGKNAEVVKATRVSGFKHPDFALLGTQLQSFSFYKEEISVLDVNYLSPIAKGAISKYVFTLEDTTWVDRDTVFIISYQPRSGKNFIGLKGLLYINTNGYAVQNVIAEPFEPNEGFNIRIQQKYELVDGRKWFPAQLNSFLYFDQVSLNNFRMVGIGRSYLSNIQLDPPLSRKDFNHVTLKIDRMATKQPVEFWDAYRTDSLDNRELRTYEFVDSLSEAENIELKLKSLQAWVSGRIPLGYVDFDLTKLLAYNEYEGIRLGGGLVTSYKFSEKWKLGVYGAYGFKDKEFKYGGDVRYTFDKKRDVYMEALYRNDVIEFGGYAINARQGLLDPAGYYMLYVNRMERYEAGELALGFRALGSLTWRLAARREARILFPDYDYTREANEFVTLEEQRAELFVLRAGLRFAPGEKFVETMTRQFAVGSKYPIFHFQFDQGLEGVMDGAHEYSRLEALVTKNFDLKNLGRMNLQLRAAAIEGDAPASLFMNPRGVNGPRAIGMFAPYAFETMTPNEFLADRLVAFHFRHNFRSLLFRTRHFAPEIVLVHNAAIGSMQEPAQHQGISYNIPEKPFLEGGLQLDNLFLSGFSGLGVGFFYRYGEWAFEDPLDNLAVKLTFRTNF